VNQNLLFLDSFTVYGFKNKIVWAHTLDALLGTAIISSIEYVNFYQWHEILFCYYI
jgi:hypothetical protein